MNMDEFVEKVRTSKNTSQNPVNPIYHPEVAPKSVSKVWFFDVQWSDCPVFVEDEVRALWREYGLGNDHYIFKHIVADQLTGDYPMINTWLRYCGVPANDVVAIHWWW